VSWLGGNREALNNSCFELAARRRRGKQDRERKRGISYITAAITDVLSPYLHLVQIT
jgi:hypothetical protein